MAFKNVFYTSAKHSEQTSIKGYKIVNQIINVFIGKNRVYGNNIFSRCSSIPKKDVVVFFCFSISLQRDRLQWCLVRAYKRAAPKHQKWRNDRGSSGGPAFLKWSLHGPPIFHPKNKRSPSSWPITGQQTMGSRDHYCTIHSMYLLLEHRLQLSHVSAYQYKSTRILIVRTNKLLRFLK